VLRDNDLGHMVTAAPQLYPHQWSWDAAFISIGLAQMSVPRALGELETLFAAQWSTGMIPHIVFSEAPGYFPGPDVWGTERAAAKPAGVATSGICQPPVHAIALARIVDLARARGGPDREVAEDFARAALPRLEAWHRWLAEVRDPEGRGVVQIHHGWESGMDNSPRWDSAYAAVEVSYPIELRRHDTAVVADAAERPTDAEYRRYLQLVKELESVGYDDARCADVVSFRVTDVFLTAILALAADETARLAESLGQRETAARQRAVAARARQGLVDSVDPLTGRCRDYDLRAGAWVDGETIASWSLALAGGPEALRARHTSELAGPRWAAHPSLRYAVPPTVSPDDPGFRPRTYWRGPTWPVITWLFTWAMQRHGEEGVARQWRDQCLALLGDGTFGEYYDAQTGLPAGSLRQSWTAAAVIDWLAASPAAGHAPPTTPGIP
jgi:hypothetical protein